MQCKSSENKYKILLVNLIPFNSDLKQVICSLVCGGGGWYFLFISSKNNDPTNNNVYF